MRHAWKQTEHGAIDFTAWWSDNGWHNGPKCVRCGEGFCRHCVDINDLECAPIRRRIAAAKAEQSGDSGAPEQ